jgi:hypothetical protein
VQPLLDIVESQGLLPAFAAIDALRSIDDRGIAPRLVRVLADATCGRRSSTRSDASARTTLSRRWCDAQRLA